MKRFKLELLSKSDICIIYDGHSVTISTAEGSLVRLEYSRTNINRCLWSMKGLALEVHVLLLN